MCILWGAVPRGYPVLGPAEGVCFSSPDMPVACWVPWRIAAGGRGPIFHSSRPLARPTPLPCSWANEFSAPRFGQGAFAACLEALHLKVWPAMP